jgi:hypothetical protein
MASPIHHAFLAFVLVGSAFAACGGKTTDQNPGTGSSSGSSAGSGGSPGGSSGSSSGSPTGSSSGYSGTSSGGGSGSSTTCVDINPAQFDQTCNQASDCFVITTGTICTGACLCGGSVAINVSGEPRYQAEVSAVATGLCPCPPELPPACSGHLCVACTGAPTDPPDCFGHPPPPADAGSVSVCMGGPTSGSGGGGDSGVCSLSARERCSDGTTYDVTCACPDAVCTCTQQSGNGGSSFPGKPFQGCADGCAPSAVNLAYEACGFPLQ